MAAKNIMTLGRYEFAIERAEFCYIDCGLEPAAWDVNVYAHCVDDAAASSFPLGVMLSAVGIPLTLSPADDYTGFALQTPRASYPDSGRSYFAVWIDGEYETWDVDFRIMRRDGTRYLLRFEAITSFRSDNGYERLCASVWAEYVPPRSTPKTDYATWLRPDSRIE